MKFIKPDFHNNIINVSASLAEHLGCLNGKPTLPVLDAELSKGYKNVVFLILDGLGMEPLRRHLGEDSFLRRHMKQVLTSVFPSTTTNATTTLLTNRYPMEHGWFGWCLYFEEIGRVVNLFPETDTFTREPIREGFVKEKLPAVPFYRGAKGVEVSTVTPEFWHGDEENRHIFDDFEGMLSLIGELCRREGRQFLYTYYPDPDSTMHRYGVSSEEADRVIGDIDRRLGAFVPTLPDTLFVITADHGQIDVGENIPLYEDRELLALLAWPQSLEARAAAFKVKEGCREQFIELFDRKYGEDFELFPVEQLVRENYFGGDGPNAARLGDFIAVGKTDKIFKLSPLSHDFKGHHTSLTAEMEVPLVLFGDKTATE